MMASFTKWDISLSGTLRAGPMGVPPREVLLHDVSRVLISNKSFKWAEVYRFLFAVSRLVCIWPFRERRIKFYSLMFVFFNSF